MAREIKDLRIKIQKRAGDADVEICYCVCEGDLRKRIVKIADLSDAQKAEIAAIVASIESDIASDESI